MNRPARQEVQRLNLPRALIINQRIANILAIAILCSSSALAQGLTQEFVKSRFCIATLTVNDKP
jgi:hypothetical protein